MKFDSSDGKEKKNHVLPPAHQPVQGPGGPGFRGLAREAASHGRRRGAAQQRGYQPSHGEAEFLWLQMFAKFKVKLQSTSTGLK